MPQRASPLPLVHKADFERLRAAPARWRSAHFAVHHVAGRPAVTARARKQAALQGLSTGGDEQPALPVDDSPDRHWLGTILPKRLARRAVTRNLLRRQIRSAVQRHLAAMPPGLWVVRLRSPFAPASYPSAASDALRQAVRQELDTMFTSSRARR